MKTFGITIMAIVVAVQLIIFGILAIACNNAVLGFMCGVGLVECWHWLIGQRKEGSDED